MGDLGLQGRIEKFTQERLSGEKPNLDQVGLTHLCSLLGDLGYREERGLFSRASQNSIDVVFNRDYINESGGGNNTWSYLNFQHPADLLSFRERYDSYLFESSATKSVGRSAVLGVPGLLLGAVFGSPIIGSFDIPIEMRGIAYGIVIFSGGVIGTGVGYLIERSAANKAKRERMEEFVNQYKAQTLTGKEALQKALTIL